MPFMGVRSSWLIFARNWLLARLADSGHDVVAMYLTRGEAGIRGKAADVMAKTKTRIDVAPVSRAVAGLGAPAPGLGTVFAEAE